MKEKIMIILIFALVLKVHSQKVTKTFNNEVFISKIGEIYEETLDNNPCAGQEVYLLLKFNKNKVAITELYIYPSSCKKESISYELASKWELINNR